MTSFQPTHQGTHITLQSLIALRALAKNIRFTIHRKASFSVGDQSSPYHGQGLDFSEVRPYFPGDDIRSMDWRVMARTGKPHTKLYHEERERPVWMVVDQRASMQFGTRNAFKSVMAAMVASLMAWSSEMNGDCVGGFVMHDGQDCFHPLKRRQMGVLPLLHSLAQKPVFAKSASSHGLNAVLRQMLMTQKSHATLVLISDFRDLDEETESFLGALSTRHQIIPFLIYDILEKEPPAPNFYGITDGDHFYTMDTRLPSFRKQYRETFQRRSKHLHRVFNRCQASMIEISTQADLLSLLKKQTSLDIS